MKSNVDLLNDYKAEKALVIGAPDERTGLEDFPSFQEWKDEYVKEYNETHKTVSVEEADAIMDAAVEEADDELETMVAEFETDETPEDEDDEMTEETTVETTEVVEKPVKKTAAKKKVAAKKTVAKKAPAKKKVVAKKATRNTSKAAKAQAIFDKLYGTKTRAEIIQKFISQAGLTANGAATYYQKMKKAAG